ncbi:MAG TPA: AraC family transcriptional regulator, partial [Puia sp.]|nr:AraC family transcriptional regulator [Puia sp.]
LNVKVDIGETLSNSYHYHPEMELILLKRSRGIRIIGASVENFTDNDLVLIGRNLPHAFLHEHQYLDNNLTDPPEAIVIQFNEAFAGNGFLDLPELKEIKRLFITARQGLTITENGKRTIIPLVEKILYSSSLDRILVLLQILKIMTDKDACRVLVSEESIDQPAMEPDTRVEKVLDFTFGHYDQNIKIEEVAEMINMTKESFCRYFKAKTGKTYLEFLIEFRIRKACRMIVENQLSIKEISYSCGFDSLSNFHYQFKKIVKQKPLEYKYDQYL